MGLNGSIHFDSASEDVDGKGWITVTFTEEDTTGPNGSPILTEKKFASITLALDELKATFDKDLEIDRYFQVKAEQQVLTTQSAAVTSAKNALLTAEGLTLGV